MDILQSKATWSHLKCREQSCRESSVVLQFSPVLWLLWGNLVWCTWSDTFNCGSNGSSIFHSVSSPCNVSSSCCGPNGLSLLALCPFTLGRSHLPLFPNSVSSSAMQIYLATLAGSAFFFFVLGLIIQCPVYSDMQDGEVRAKKKRGSEPQFQCIFTQRGHVETGHLLYWIYCTSWLDCERKDVLV